MAAAAALSAWSTMALTGAGPAAAAPSPPPSPSPSGHSRQAISARALAAVGAHRLQVRGGDGQRFRVVDLIVDRNGASHARMTRTYEGLPVLGGDIVVHQSADGTWQGTSQTLAGVPTETDPTIAAAEAQRIAAAPGTRVRGRAVLAVEARHGTRRPRLAWVVPTEGRRSDGSPTRQKVSVDAGTGEVLLRDETYKTTIAPGRSRPGRAAPGKTTPSAVGEAGTGRSLYGGTVPLTTLLTSGSYQLKDPTRGGTYTADAQNKWSTTGAKIFTDADNRWGDGTLADRATVAVDAQYGTDATWDYYLKVHGRNGIGNDGKGSSNVVHYGKSYANAGWDDATFSMTYGDGDSTAGPFTSLDIAGHEMTHGVTSKTAGLIYEGESGGLNEATSDIFGTLVEFHAQNATARGDYLLGDGVFKNGEPLRYMDKPSKDRYSVDCWSPTTKDLEVHASSGIGNHFFYLLSEGSGPKRIDGVSYDSPACDGSTVTGIGRDAAGRIWYRALTAYLTSDSDYKGARTATLSAAKDLFGAGSPQYTSVAAAWSAVAVL